MSWVKLSALLFALSGLLLLRIKLEPLVDPSHDAFDDFFPDASQQYAHMPNESADQLIFGVQQGPDSTQPTLIATPTGLLDTDTGSLVGGLVYFVLAAGSLAIGTADYLRRERALEHIDALSTAEKEAQARLEADRKARRRRSRRRTRSMRQASVDLGSEEAQGQGKGQEQQEQRRASVAADALFEREADREEEERQEAVVRDIRRMRNRYLAVADEDIGRARSGRIVKGLAILLALVIAASTVLLLIDERGMH